MTDKGFGRIANNRRGLLFYPADRSILIGLQNDYQAGFRGEEVKIARKAGEENQGTGAVAVGYFSATYNQGFDAVAIGPHAGTFNQTSEAIAIGLRAGEGGSEDTPQPQGRYAIAIGESAGQRSQQIGGIAVGIGAGQDNQGDNAIAIGNGAGNLNQSVNSIAIGNGANRVDTTTMDNIVINATGEVLNPVADESTVIKPLRFNSATDGNNPFSNAIPAGFDVAIYNPTTGELARWAPP